MAVNGQPVYLEKMEKNKLKIDDLKGANDLHEYLENAANFPCQLRFGKPALTTNDKLVLTGRFFGFVYLNLALFSLWIANGLFLIRLYSLAWQLAPVEHSSGIEVIETDLYKLYCFHTITGMKFIAITDSRQQNVETFLRKTYEIYADYGLKNPFYLMDQPIRSDLFDSNLQYLIDSFEK